MSMVADRLTRIKLSAKLAVTAKAQTAALAALQGDQSFLLERNAAFKKRRDMVVEMLNEAEGIRCLKPEGAFYLYPSRSGAIGKQTPDGKIIETGEDFVTYLLESEGVSCVQGAALTNSVYKIEASRRSRPWALRR